MAKDVGVPGNALQEQADMDRRTLKLGIAVRQLEHWCEKLVPDHGIVKAIRFKAPRSVGGEWLVVVQVSTEKGGVVGFHSADDFSEAVKGLSSRLRNGSIKWRDDEYA